MLTDKELALLAAKLEIPVIVTDIIDEGHAELADELRLSLHSLISDMEPDTALLGIAMGVKKIVHAYAEVSPTILVLELECDRIIDDYGPLWLQNAQGHEAPDQGKIFDVLSGAAEDLEGLTELLEVNTAFLTAKDPLAAGICDIFAIQASAQAIIAEAFIEAAANTPAPAKAMPPAAFTGNVVPFPIQAHRV